MGPINDTARPHFFDLPLDLHAQSDKIVLSMSRDEVVITASFNGSDILVFGEVKRETETPEGTVYVTIAILGPLLPVIVLRKERTHRIWAHRDMVVVDAALSFYTVATSRNWDQMISRRKTCASAYL